MDNLAEKTEIDVEDVEIDETDKADKTEGLTYLSEEELQEILSKLDSEPMCASSSAHTGLCCTFP